MEAVRNYGDVPREYAALSNSAGLLDLSFRSRLCVLGSDRARFLHGQVTNDVKRLQAGDGCYAALISAKGKLESDLNIYCLSDEILLDFEPGLLEKVASRLEKYVIADDVQIVPVQEPYGLLSVQGPRAAEAIRASGLTVDLPTTPFRFTKPEGTSGEVYLVNQPRLGAAGFDLFVPSAGLASVFEQISAGVSRVGGRLCGWEAFEITRIEQGIPRFGQDMDETNIPLEAGIEERAISFNKGCYIGQEVISRIRTYGQVTKSLRGLRFDPTAALPTRGDKLHHAGKEVGYITSVVHSPRLQAQIALGYVRKEVNQLGTRLSVGSALVEASAEVVSIPFVPTGERAPNQRVTNQA